MNASKNIVLALAALFMISGALAVLSDSSDADTEYTMTVYGTYEWCRTTEKVHVGAYASSGTNMFFKSADYDETFQQYIEGKLKYSDLSSDYDSSVGGDYYIYFLNSESPSYYDGTQKYPATFDHKKFEYPSTQWNLLNPGTNKVKILSITDNSGTEESTKKVSLKQYGNSYYGMQMGKNDSYQFYSGDKAFAFYLTTQAAGVPTVGTVTFTMTNPLKSLNPGTATTEISLATQCKWLAGETMFQAGQYRYNNTDKIVMVLKGSEQERQFLAEVVNAGKGIIPAELRLQGDFDIPASATYSIYKLDTSTYSYDTLYLSYENRISHTYQSLNFPCKTLSGPSGQYNVFSPANTEVSVTVEYDESKYQALWITNISAYDYNSALVPLPSGYVMKNTATSSSDGYVYIIYIGNGNEDGVMKADLKISVSGAAEPTGAPTALIGVSIALCVIPFLLLGLSGMKPKWAN